MNEASTEQHAKDAPTPPMVERFDGATSPGGGRVRYAEHGWRGEFIARTPLHEWLLAGGRPDRIHFPESAVVRDGSRSRCARIVQLDERTPLSVPLFFKVYRMRPGAQAWVKRRIGWHLPSWVWRTSWRLLEADIPVPRPWGYVTPNLLRPELACYYWAEWVEHAVPAKNLAREPDRRHVVTDRRFARQTAEILARLHGAGCYHRDMNWGNLLVDATNDRVWLVDLDSAHHWTLSARAAACRDLARLLMDAQRYEAPPDWREQFLEHYASLRGLERDSLEQRVQSKMSILLARRRVKRQKTRRP